MSLPDPTPQPSNAELLAAIQSLAAAVGAVDGKVDALAGKVDQLAADVMAVKVDTGFIDRHIADFHGWARAHETNPRAHGQAA